MFVLLSCVWCFTFLCLFHHSCAQTTLFLRCWKAAGDTEVDGKLKCNEIIWVAERSGAVWCQSYHSRSESCYQRHRNSRIIVRQYRTILTARVIYANEVILHANAIYLLHDQCSGSANYAYFLLLWEDSMNRTYAWCLLTQVSLQVLKMLRLSPGGWKNLSSLKNMQRFKVQEVWGWFYTCIALWEENTSICSEIHRTFKCFWDTLFFFCDEIKKY